MCVQIHSKLINITEFGNPLEIFRNWRKDAKLEAREKDDYRFAGIEIRSCIFFRELLSQIT